jgi:methylglutaconyl-CoA hydratase
MTTELGTVTSTVSNGVATISFFHPRSNSLPGALLRKIAAAVDEAGDNPSAKVVVLKSDGDKAFCGGASFDELCAVRNLDEAKYFFSGFATLILAMRRCPKFVICRVQGKAAGGGVGVAAAADYTLATKAASARLSELAIGIGPFIIGPAVERKIGAAAFGEMAVDADWRDAGWAKARGLYVETYDTIAELDEAVNVMAERLAGCHEAAMRRLKGVLWEGTEHWPELLPARAAITSELALTEFVQTTVAALQGR